MVKHTQTIRRQKPSLSVFNHFVGLALKSLNNDYWLIISHLNTNLLRNKFEMLQEIDKDKLHIFLISETKLYLSFSSSQSTIEGFSSPFRIGRNSSGG